MLRYFRFAVLLLFATSPVIAQENPPAEPTQQTEKPAGKFGIGVTLNPAALIVFDEELLIFPSGFNNFMFQIRGSERLIWEPEFGLVRFSSSGGGFETSSTLLRLGVGALFETRSRGDMRPYIGPRTGIIRSSSKDESSFGSFSSRRTDWYLSFVMGSQYYFSQHFSLGGEIQFTRLSLGKEKTDPPSGGGDVSSSSITTAGLMMLRWYF
jgi:hypothetical protein